MSKEVDNKVLNIFVCPVLIIFLIVFYFIFSGFKESIRDKTPPEIKILNNDLRFYDTEDINYFDYVEISDDSNEFDARILNEEFSKLPGKRTVQIEATDSSGNVSNECLSVNIISMEDWKNFVVETTNGYQYRRIENLDYENNKGVADYDAFNLALEFLGMPGYCSEVAQAFINAYYGEEYDIFNTYPVTKEDAVPGDIIYYVDGGLGEQHFAVYLGGSSALQGNIYGTTVIGSVYMNYGTEPQFGRLIGK